MLLEWILSLDDAYKNHHNRNDKEKVNEGSCNMENRKTKNPKSQENKNKCGKGSHDFGDPNYTKLEPITQSNKSFCQC